MADRRRRYVPLARRVLVVQVLVVVLAVGVATATGVAVADRLIVQGAQQRVIAVATTMANSPGTRDALVTADPADALGPLAERVRSDAELSFLVFMDPDGIRYTHPDPDRIGGSYIGDLDQARETGQGTERTTGTLGESVRAVARIDDPADGEVLGFVSAGITVDRLRDVLWATLPLLLGSAAGAAVLGLVIALVFRAWVRARTWDLSADDIAREHVHLQAVLGAVREGLVVVDDQGRVVVANAAARRLLDLPDDTVGRSVMEVVDPDLAALLASGEPVSDATAVAGERVVVVNSRPTAPGDPDGGEMVTTIRDLTQLRQLTDELGSVGQLLASLRAQAHEADNRLQTVVALVELGEPDEAIELATAASQRAQQLTDDLLQHVGDPVVAALLLGKTSDAHERGIELTIESADGTDLRGIDVPKEDLVTILGNLVDNALESVAEAAPRRPCVTIGTRLDGGMLEVTVTDNGTGLGGRSFAEVAAVGYSTKTGTEPGAGTTVRGFGTGIVARTVQRLGGTVELSDRSDGSPGATAVVRLPTAAHAPAVAPTGPDGAHEVQR